MKKGLKITLIVIAVVLAVIAAFVGGMVLYSRNYTPKDQAASIANETGLVQARGKSLYDADGNRLQLKGINAGQILLQEGWMSPFALEPLKNEDGKRVENVRF